LQVGGNKVSLGRIFVIATNVFREVVRDRILYIIGFYGILLAAAIRLKWQLRLKIKSSWTLASQR